MNCKQYKEKLADALAAREAALPAELAVHQRACADCGAFYESQKALFRSLDAGLLAVANQPVPPSFLPDVRARLNEQAIPAGAWFPRWKFAAIGAAAIFAVAVGLLWYRPVSHPGLPEIAPAVLQTANNPASAVQPPPSQRGVSPSLAPQRVNRVASPAKVTKAGPEVIVLPEEREAFARFVARLLLERDVALALTRPAPARDDAPVEIALLDLGSVEVKPLESEAGE